MVGKKNTESNHSRVASKAKAHLSFPLLYMLICFSESVNIEEQPGLLHLPQCSREAALECQPEAAGHRLPSAGHAVCTPQPTARGMPRAPAEPARRESKGGPQTMSYRLEWSKSLIL